MWKEVLKLMFMAIGLVGFMLVVGSAGALELGNIGINQAIGQVIRSLGIVVFSVIGYKAVSWGDSEMY